MKEVSGSFESSNMHEVIVCTGECLFSGMMPCGVHQRLIDAINEGAHYGASARSIRFLPLTRARELIGEVDKKDHHIVYIAKANIIFVARGKHEIKQKLLTTYPYRKKVSVRIRIYALPNTISGNLHVDTWGQIPDAIESKAMFMPITDVEVSPPLPTGQRHFDFIAVNRSRISYVSEEG